MSTTEPPYARIVAEIRARIASGQLRPGDRVPSVRRITREWGVAIATATKVLDSLRNLGVVVVRPGLGTLVAPPSPVAAPSLRPAARTKDGERMLDRIVRMAIEVADEEGLAALSMRRIATQLGAATMALYRHVESKDELVLAMIEHAFAENPPPPDADASWRARLETLARVQWTGYRRHPWLASVVSITRPQLLPRGMVHTEAVLRQLTGLGLDGSTMLHAAVTLIAYVRGMALSFEAQASAERDSGMTDAEWMDSHDARYAEVIGSGEYPNLAATTADPSKQLDLDSLFEFGLQRLLDGYAVLFGARPG